MAFNDFVETELPKRPYTAADGLPGQIPVRSGNALAVRELVWMYAADLIAAGGGNALNKIDLPAAGAVSGHRVMRATGDGHVVYASSAALADANSVIGISVNAAADQAMVSVQYAGQIVEPSWAWTPNLPVFCGVAGALTQTAPTSGFALVVGIATAATAILVGVKQPIITT